MRTPIKLAACALGLIALFGASTGVGRLVGPSESATPAHAADSGGHADDGDHTSTTETVAEPPGGLQVAQDGFRLTPVTGSLRVGAPAEFAFRILGPDRKPVTGYTPTHEKDLHLIVVRRDLSGFQHLHPALAADGTWSLPIAVPAAGQYRIFTDFQPAGRAEALTLGVDVPAPGDYRPAPLPAPARSATVDGYTVALAGDLVPGTSSRLTLSVSRDGKPVTDLQPYLGAYGHLVALRDGDLAYLHVHPDGTPGDGRTSAGPRITFYAEVPSAGDYRLFLDFRHAGRVHTAAFTASAGGVTPIPAGTPITTPAAGESDPGHGHDE
jgi:hypothetical protein